MSRISVKVVAQAIADVRVLDMKQKEHLLDELFRDQPNMLGMFLVQQRMGVSFEKMDFLLNILITCFQAMTLSGLAWPLISIDEQDRQMARHVASVRFGADLGGKLEERAMAQYIENHPEKALLAYVMTETANWLKRIEPEESDRRVMLAAVNFVNCIAFIPMPAARPKARRSKAVLSR